MWFVPWLPPGGAGGLPACGPMAGLWFGDEMSLTGT